MAFHGGYRCRANVRACFACVIDVDDGSPLEPILEAIDGLFVLVHTTYSATPDAERWRVVVPLDRPVGADAYDRVWRWIASALEEVGVAPDYGGAPACQPWAVPCIPPSGFYRHQERFWTSPKR